MYIHTYVHAYMPTILPTYLTTYLPPTYIARTYDLHTYAYRHPHIHIYTHTHGQIRTYIVYDIYSNPTYTDILQISRFLISVLEANTFLPWIHVNRHTIKHIWHSTSYSSSYLSSHTRTYANKGKPQWAPNCAWRLMARKKPSQNCIKLLRTQVQWTFLLQPIMVRIPPERWHKEVYTPENHFPPRPSASTSAIVTVAVHHWAYPTLLGIARGAGFLFGRKGWLHPNKNMYCKML